MIHLKAKKMNFLYDFISYFYSYFQTIYFQILSFI